MTFAEGTAGACFQVAFKGVGFGVIGEPGSRYQLPGAKARCVGRFAGVVFGKAGRGTGGSADVVALAMPGRSRVEAGGVEPFSRPSVTARFFGLSTESGTCGRASRASLCHSSWCRAGVVVQKWYKARSASSHIFSYISGIPALRCALLQISVDIDVHLLIIR